MANTKSALKRIKQNRKRRLRNRLITGQTRASIKNARSGLESGDLDVARDSTRKAASALDRAAAKGVLHKNNAARRKSRLMRRLAKLEKESS